MHVLIIRPDFWVIKRHKRLELRVEPSSGLVVIQYPKVLQGTMVQMGTPAEYYHYWNDFHYDLIRIIIV